jgi:hypothetical protein
MNRQIVACAAAAAIAVAVPPASVRAQVGHDPATSPYKDIEHSQELTVFGGFLQSGKDPAGVAWRGGPMVGARYDIHLAGPAYFYGRAGAVQSERTIIDPAEPEATRVIGDRTGTLLLADLGLSLSLTGHKSWRGLSPMLSGGGGMIADFRGTDIGGYRFGTPFALSFGGGLRWVPGGRVQGRVDYTDFLYRVAYPEGFYRPTDEVPAFLGSDVARSRWTHNGAFTVSLSYVFGR